MNTKLSKIEVLALILACLLPLGALVMGAVLLFKGYLLTTAFVIAYIALPVCIIAAFTVTIFSTLVSWKKAIIMLPLVIVFCIGFLFASFGRFEMLKVYRADKVEEAYFKVWGEYDVMPSLREVGNPESAEYYDFYCQAAGIFVSESDTLVLKYSKEEYEKETARIEEYYAFESEACLGYGESICEHSCKIDGYLFRFLDTDGTYKEIEFPKTLIIVGTNDETCEIVYTVFHDPDLDYIESFSDFMLEDCGWRRISKRRK